MKHIVIADDHPMCRQAIRIALSSLIEDYSFVEAKTISEALTKSQHSSLTVLDLILPDALGLSGLLALCSAHSGGPVLVVTGYDAPYLEPILMAAGAAGYVSKNSELEELATAARTLITGGKWFRRITPEGTFIPADNLEFDITAEHEAFAQKLMELTKSEKRVLAAMSDGSLNKQIAYNLDISEVTVKQHIKSILKKTNAINRTQAALMVSNFFYYETSKNNISDYIKDRLLIEQY